MKKHIVSVLLIALTFQIACGVYSFSGASVPSNVKTISIDYIENRAPNSWNSLDRIFNRVLRQKLINDAGLKVVDKDGDYSISGSINSYRISVQAATQGSFSNSYRLDIGANISFKNNVSEKNEQWSQVFSNFEAYEGDIAGKEDVYIENISDRIANDVFNKLFSTW